jgi:hypothetical protein
MKLEKVMKVIIFATLIAIGSLGNPLHAQLSASNADEGVVNSATDSRSVQEQEDQVADEGSTSDEEQSASAQSQPEYKYVPVRTYSPYK